MPMEISAMYIYPLLRFQYQGKDIVRGISLRTFLINVLTQQQSGHRWQTDYGWP